MTPTSGEIRPEAELQKAFCSSNFSADDLVVDMIRDTLNKLPVARMAACRTKYMAGVVAALSPLGVRPVRSEPSPCALVRLAERQYRAPRRAKAVLRVFLGVGQGLAVVVTGGLPQAWKTFAMTAGMEGFAILSAARGLATQQTHYGIETALDYAIIHGRADLHESLQQEQLPSELKTRVIWQAEPGLDGAATAFGLALGCLSPDIKAFDLSRTLKSRAPVREIFPWKESAFAASLVVGMGAVLGAQSMRLDETYVALQAENSQHVCLATGDVSRLEKDKKGLQEKVDAVRAFLESRMLWTSYTSDVAGRMPPKATLTVFGGKLTGPAAASKGAAGTFDLLGTAPLAPDGSIPREIDAFLGAIPKAPLWKRDFSSVATDMKLPMSAGQDHPVVAFSVKGQYKGGANGSK